MVIGLMNKLEDIGKIYRKISAVLAPSMEEYGTKLAPYSISCATKNVNLLPDPVDVMFSVIHWHTMSRAAGLSGCLKEAPETSRVNVI